MALTPLERCPLCDSARIARLHRNLTRKYEGQEYVVPNLTYYECPDCGERVFDPEAMDKIEAYSPAFTKSKRPRKKPSAGGRKPSLMTKSARVRQNQALARTS